eukprot:9441493-Pyramimonas_sp.AAC.1
METPGVCPHLMGATGRARGQRGGKSVANYATGGKKCWCLVSGRTRGRCRGGGEYGVRRTDLE